jgi:hypothetical protein
MIEVLGKRVHAKASEEYIDVVFRYPDEGGYEWRGSVPILYRRTGTHVKTEQELKEVLASAYEAMRPSSADEWRIAQEEFWKNKNADVTGPFFRALSNNEWNCVACDLPPNPNWARRVQAIKDMGYTLATDTGRACRRCGKRTTHIILLRMPRGGNRAYETWSPHLRERIVKVLGNCDVYEDTTASKHLVPDHKFSEIRWDEATGQANPDDMTDQEIRAKFQLISNQRNEQKREVCRTCFQTGKRGYPFGTKFFYEGGEDWPASIPRAGRAAEAGCVGCGWYDMKKWREALNERLAD